MTPRLNAQDHAFAGTESQLNLSEQIRTSSRPSSRLGLSEQGSTRTVVGAVQQHYLTRTLSQPTALRSSFISSHSPQHVENLSRINLRDKQFSVYPNCRGELVIHDVHMDDTENNNVRDDATNEVPLPLQRCGISFAEYSFFMGLLKSRLKAWKGPKIYATALISIVLGESHVAIFYAESSYYLILTMLLALMVFWITECWLTVELGVLQADVQILFAAWMPFINTTFTRNTNVGGIAPYYSLSFVPSRQNMGYFRQLRRRQENRA